MLDLVLRNGLVLPRKLWAVLRLNPVMTLPQPPVLRGFFVVAYVMFTLRFLKQLQNRLWKRTLSISRGWARFVVLPMLRTCRVATRVCAALE